MAKYPWSSVNRTPYQMDHSVFKWNRPFRRVVFLSLSPIPEFCGPGPLLFSCPLVVLQVLQKGKE